MRNQVIVDCGATHHMFNSPNFFPNSFEEIKSEVSTGDSQSNLLAHGIGDAELKCNGQTLKLKNCLFVPKLKCNLISMLELFKDQLTIKRRDNSFFLSSKGEILLKGEIRNRLMYITYDLPNALLTLVDGNLWHSRLGHPGRAVLKNLGLPDQDRPCLVCKTNKSSRLPFNHHFEPVSHPLDTIHIDLVGPIAPESVSGFRFLLTIVDQATSYKIIRFLKRKSDSFDQFVIAKNYMENHHDRKIKKLVSDRGGEFLNQKFENLSNRCGFVHILSPPETPEHNGYAERANRTVMEKARCLMNHSNLPNQYWAEAVNTAVFLSNLSPTPSRENKSPHYLWTNTSAKLTKIRTFGCQAVIHSLKRQRDWKLAPSGQKGVLLGFENDNTAYRILRLSDLKVVVTRNVTFEERIFPTVGGGIESPLWNIEDQQTDKDSGLLASDPPLSDCGYNQCSDCPENVTTEDSADLTSALDNPSPDSNPGNPEESSSQQQSADNCRTNRIKVIGPRHPTLITSEVDTIHILPYSRRARTFITTSDSAPRTYRLALQCENKDKWINAIAKELSAMNELKVWDIIDLRSDYKLVGTTWVFKVKKNHLHQDLEYKARLCAQGFTQTPGVDFEKTYAPTGRLNSLRALIAHSCANGLDFHQIDVKSAFLNAPLIETVYLSIPQGLEIDRRKHCLRLKKAIYGLKQAPLAWYNRLKDWLQGIGFNACKLDPCVFYRKEPDALWIYVHVDDMAIFGTNIQLFKEQINKEFNIKDIGPADLLLGVKIQQQNDCITLDQQHFVDSLLDLYGMQHCKTVTTPLVPNEYLSPATDDERKTFEELGINFRSAVGSINYLSTATRPDLSHAVSSLSQYLEKPGIRHWKAFLHILKYLRGTQELGLYYNRQCIPGLIAFADADWGNCQITRRSTSGYLATLHGCLIFWKTRKQPLVSISTAEAEYKSLCDLTSELLWFRQWCQEADIFCFKNAITIWEDNQSCIKTANGNCNVNTKRMKHVDIQLHFVKEAIQKQLIELRYAPTSDMLADFLTKAVPKTILEKSLTVLGVVRLGSRGGVEKRSHEELRLVPS
ncbi:hypothetical protein O181_079618 [Austropuccinia psidii MF-1]|uniref:Integrase catalytic domain-containing protein n=1 Tax=Austropuccinia psidii MF-1 TaxID=1389203 RepID=A0A9Q3IFS4_9BASI|nr:hypothetical protein [Austropuccinia psidii MF-1]